MSESSELELIEEEMESQQFVGFDRQDVEGGLRMIAAAVHKEAVTNSTTLELREGLRDPRSFLIQNHGTLKAAMESWRPYKAEN